MATKKATKKTTSTAKKTTSSTSSVEANYNKTLIEIQKLANNSAKSIQQMVNTSNEKQMQFNKTEAATARNWEKMMSDTSHQREVKDLKKSGLNPVLSVNSGAQSYTTSSASTNNDSGASATGAILEGQLGALSSLESSRMSATAQLKASAQAAAATRYAAKQSAAAQRYAAKQAAAASNYRANIENEMNKRTTEAQLKIADIQKGNTVAGFVDKYLTKFGVTGAAENFIKKQVTPKLKTVLNKIRKDPYSMFQKSNNTITKSNFLLNKSGVKYFNNLTKTFGLKVNKANRRMVVRAVVFHDRPAMNVVMRSYSDHWQHSSKRPQRRGHL